MLNTYVKAVNFKKFRDTPSPHVLKNREPYIWHQFTAGLTVGVSLNFLKFTAFTYVFSIKKLINFVNIMFKNIALKSCTGKIYQKYQKVQNGASAITVHAIKKFYFRDLSSNSI